MDRRKRLAHLGWLTLMVLVAFWVGNCLQPHPAVKAGVREVTPKQHFLAGSERSLPVLQDISATLKQIDARLSRIEQAVTAAAEREAKNQPARAGQ